jgi:hypothetical protein
MFEDSRSRIRGSDGLYHETEDRKSKGKSAFERQKIVGTGLVRNVCSSVSLSASDGRVWIGSSVKSFSGVLGRMSVIAFEKGSILEVIWDSGFRESGLQSIVVPSSVVVLSKDSFFDCKSLESVTFESGSRLERIEAFAFYGSGLKSIKIPSSVVVLGEKCFCDCKSLRSVTFESGSRLERLDELAFSESGLTSIRIPSSVVVLGEMIFCWCESLESVTFESGSRLERIGEWAFCGCGLKSIEIPLNVAFVSSTAFDMRALTSISVSLGHQHFRICESFLEDVCGSTIYRHFGYYRSICIPYSVVVLGKWSFYECESLESVTFESGSRLERIEESAFSESGLTSIKIP